jgi:hypothetical protein
MKKIMLTFFGISIAALFSACYFNNTRFQPSIEGFHLAYNSPFAGGAQAVASMAAGNGTVAAVAANGTIAYSQDSGAHWEKVKPENILGNFTDGIRFNAVTWGEGYFLAGGEGGKAAYSEDGVVWQAGVIGPMNPRDILCVAAGSIMGEKVFVAAGIDGRLAHAVGSPAGPWYQADQKPFGDQAFGEAVRAVAWGKIKGSGVFVACGDNGKIAFMKDFSGKWWGGRAGTGETFRSIAFGNDRFIACGDNGVIKHTADPLDYSWNTVKNSDLGYRPVSGIAFDPLIKHFVLYTSDTIVAFSEYGEDWNAANFSKRFTAGISSVTCTGSRIIFGGNDGIIAYSN